MIVELGAWQAVDCIYQPCFALNVVCIAAGPPRWCWQQGPSVADALGPNPARQEQQLGAQQAWQQRHSLLQRSRPSACRTGWVSAWQAWRCHFRYVCWTTIQPIGDRVVTGLGNSKAWLAVNCMWRLPSSSYGIYIHMQTDLGRASRLAETLHAQQSLSHFTDWHNMSI